MIPCPVPGCTRKFGSEVALRFHGKADHPTEEATYLISQKARAVRQEERVADTGTLSERARGALDRLDRDCPCGNSLAWHRRQGE